MKQCSLWPVTETAQVPDPSDPPASPAPASPVHRGGEIGRGAGPVQSWLCAQLPLLALEVFTRADPDPGAAIVVAGQGRTQQVLAATEAAHRLGVQPGMRASAAHALGALQVYARDEVREGAALAELATWGGQFTPRISLAPPDAVLFEVQGSRRLFGDFERLRARLRAGLAALGYTCRLATAPVPLAATLLARAGRELHVGERARLAGALAGLPVELLGTDARTGAAIRALGVGTLGALARLPRAGLARRFGPGLVESLERALGRRPDPRPSWQPPARFEQRLELAQAVRETGPLLFAAQRLLLALAGFLRARDAGVERFVCRLEHDSGPATAVTVGLRAPARDARHLLGLLRARLEGTGLPAPVAALGLAAEALVPWPGAGEELFEDAPARPGARREALVERLRARLGEDAVSGLCLVPDARPERAWRACEPGETGAGMPARRRPLWLLAAPQPLALSGGTPRLRGRLTPVSGRERLEGGWWDGADVAREYFVAVDPGGSRLWIFRDLRTRRWYLHGIFD